MGSDRSLRAALVLHNLVARFRDGQRGATAVEYGMLVALIAAVIVVIVQALGIKLNAAFNTINDALG